MGKTKYRENGYYQAYDCNSNKFYKINISFCKKVVSKCWIICMSYRHASVSDRKRKQIDKKEKFSCVLHE